MKKEAEMLALADRLRAKYENWAFGSKGPLILVEAEAALRAAAQPAPDAGLVERLPVIPDDDADFTPDLARKIIAKYQALLSSPPRAVAGEPVAFDPMSIDDVEMRALLSCKDVGSGRQMLKRLIRPAPSGRDPATIEAEARFLLDRLEELDDANDAEYVREFEGHVRPPMTLLRRLLPHS